jgi:hypothetical protein
MKTIPFAKIFSFITGGAAVIGVLFGIFKFIDSANRTTKAVTEQTEKIELLREAVTRQDTTIENLRNGILVITGEVNALSGSLTNTQKSYTRYLLRDNTLTKEEFYEYMRGIEVKKKAINLDSVNYDIKWRKLHE